MSKEDFFKEFQGLFPSQDILYLLFSGRQEFEREIKNDRGGSTFTQKFTTKKNSQGKTIGRAYKEVQDAGPNKAIIRCSKCNQLLRVPINLGKLKITCPLCKWQGEFDPDKDEKFQGVERKFEVFPPSSSLFEDENYEDE